VLRNNDGDCDLGNMHVHSTARVQACNIHSAHLALCALRVAGVTQEPSECLFLDDSTSNMRAAKAVGWRTVLVGQCARDSGDAIVCEHADYAVDQVHELRRIMPELFLGAGAGEGAGVGAAPADALQ